MRPFGTYDEIADFMITTSWTPSTGGPRKWDIGPGDAITVNISGLTAPARALAEMALQRWEDVGNFTFDIINGFYRVIQHAEGHLHGRFFWLPGRANGVVYLWGVGHFDVVIHEITDGIVIS